MGDGPDRASDWTKVVRLGAPALVAALTLALRLYHLASEPSDIYGDIVILFKYVQAVVDGKYPFYFVDSTGPLYHYLIAPLGSALGLNYLTVKLASVLVSLLVLGVTYLLARVCGAGRLGAWLAVLLGGSSSWLLVFSRLGNSQIITPLLSALTFYVLARARQRYRVREIATCAVCAALGFYAYPQTFVLGLAAAAAMLWWCSRGQMPWRALGTFLVLTTVLTLPFLAMVAEEPSAFVEGYIGGKMMSGNLAAGLREWPGLYLRSLLMLHVRGDVIFRSNPPGLPHLDPITGFFFLVGMARVVRERDGVRAWLVIWPFLFLQLPATLVLNFPGEVPSASRTLLVTPFVYVLAASGLEEMLSWPGRVRRWEPFLYRASQPPFAFAPGWRLTLLAATGVLVAAMNAQRYFSIYIPQLPNRNVSFTQEIASAMDAAAEDTTISVYGCCWGEWSTPEWEDIPWALKRPRQVDYLDAALFDCAHAVAVSGPQLIIADPSDPALTTSIEACFPAAKITEALGPGGMQIYRAFWLVGP